MTSSIPKGAVGKLPDGYAAIAISAEQNNTPLKICVLVKLEPDPAAGHLVLLRDTIDAKIFLGCIVDTGQQVHQWLELWIQSLENLPQTVIASRQTLTNAILDEQWLGRYEAFVATDEKGLIKTGGETAHTKPVFLDISLLEAKHPEDSGTGYFWQLCQDDALLAGKELPEYSKSLHRYLYLKPLGADSAFIPVTPQAPTNAHIKNLSEIYTKNDHIIPLNPAGGFMLVRRCGVIGLESYIDLLGGGPWEGKKHGRTELYLDPSLETLKNMDTEPLANGRLFLGSHGGWGSLVETFHLKLCLLSEVITSVQTMVYNQQQPFLNLSPDSFQVRMGDLGYGLPFLWTAGVMLVEPGNVIALPIETSDAQYYQPAGWSGTSIYRPVSASGPIQGRGTVRIRQVLSDKSEKIILEGTLTTQERIEGASNDLIWLRLNLASGRLDLYGHLEAKGELAMGEWRFRTIGQRFNDIQASSLRAAEGVPIPDTRFETVSLLSSPCDLYSLAVLAVRTLLVNSQTTLPVALDEMLSLARQVEVEYDDSAGLNLRIQKIFNEDHRWVESLGPHRLIYEQVTPEDAIEVVPDNLWYKLLAMIVRMFPGVGRDSLCRDYADAPPGGLHKVFDPLMPELDNLLLRTRNLIVTDCKFNREINNIIQNYLGVVNND